MNEIEVKTNNKNLSQFIDKLADSDFRERFVTNAGQQVMINHVREHLSEGIYDYICESVAISVCEDAKPEVLKLVGNAFRAGAIKCDELGHQLLKALSEIAFNFAIKSISPVYTDAEWGKLAFDVDFDPIDLSEFTDTLEQAIREFVNPNLKTKLSFFKHYLIPPCQVRLEFRELVFAEEIFHHLEDFDEWDEGDVHVVYNVGGNFKKDEPLTKERADKITEQAMNRHSIAVVYAGVNDEYEKPDNDWGVTVGWLMENHLAPTQLLECNLRAAIESIHDLELID